MLHSLQQLIASCGRCTTSSARQLVVLLLSATFGLGAQAQSSSIADCSLFAPGPNDTWTHALTATTPDDPNSSAEQTLQLNVVSLPEGGANYRVAKTVANGNWFNGNAQPLSLGENVITVSAVSFARSVKFQFSSGEVIFEALVLNSTALDDCFASDPGTPIGECNLFDAGPNATWTHVLTATTPDDPNSSAAQTLVLNVVSLPEGGANYRVAKTVANGNWFNGNAQALALGENTITVSAVSFARSVKFQFSSGAVGLSALALNGADLICGAGCTDASACNYDDSATADDGSCTFPASESVDCDGNCLVAVDCAGECGGSATLDDCGVCGGDGSSCAQANVTFHVDMNLYGDLGASTVFVNGSFNGWCGACNPMADADGDGIWSVTLPLDPGTIEYKFTVDGWNNQENFAGGESCTSTIDGYTNRTLTFDADTELDVVCWGSCDACPDEVIYHDLTLEVNTSNIEVGPNGMYAGGGVLGDAQAVALSDDDADGIWSATISVLEGTSGNYVFLNSPNDGGDWGAKEVLAGLPCSDPANYDDRILEPVMAPTTISTCFGQCSTDGSCAAPPASFDVTFQVDMSQYQGAIGTVNLNGNFSGWCGSCIAMSDDNGDGIYNVTVELSAGQIEYKFTVDGWNAQEEFAGGESCTLTSGGFTNRVYEVTEEATLSVVCWNSCDACPAIEDVLGCMDSSANNYNEEATADNGSCLYNTTFNVDMSCAGVDFYEVFVTGPIWGWPANSGFNQLLDDDGDGIYSVTIETPAGDVEYKYAVDGWADQENLIDDMQNGASCAPVTDYNGYANRLAASGSSTSDTYGSCDACPEEEFSIQVAIDQAAEGATIEIPAGDYHESLVINKGLVLTSASGAQDVNLYPPSGTGISIQDGPDNVVVSNLTIVGNELVGSGITVSPGASNIQLANNSISNILLPGGGNSSPLSYGILVWGDSDPVNPPTGITIENNSISNVLGSAISLGSNTVDVTIAGNVFSNIVPVDFGGTPLAIGIQAELCAGLEISSNEFNDLLQATSLVNCSDVELDNNSYNNTSLLLLTTWPHDIALDAEPWWSTTLSADGVNLSEAFFSNPSDPTYLYFASLGMFSQSSSNPGCLDDFACNYDPTALSDDGSCLYLDECGVCGGDSSTCLDCAGVPNGTSVLDECGVCGGDGSSCADPGTPIADCNLFADGPNANWPHVLTATTPDDPNSSAAQTLILNVASLPEGGANYRVAKTVANGNWFNGNAQALALGENTITVGAVSFARSVKFQFSSGDVGLSALALNGADLICSAGCTDASACNYDGSATADDGSCEYPDSELVDCDGNCLVAVDCEGVCGGDAALDDCGVCGGDGSSCAQANVTFQVDMNLYGDLGASTVFVNGSFNGWCGACNPMADADGDGIWSVTLPLDPGTIEYKFTVDGWNNQENFAGGESCTSTIDGYTNRTLTFDADTELDVVCWGSCDACPDEVIYHDLTLEVNTSNIEVGPNGMYAGGGVLGDAQAVALSDDDADGIWSATISVLEGTSGNYTFLNSPNDGGDWGAKEDLSGQDCADPDNYNDRILAPVMEPTTLSTCFGECSTDGSCSPPPTVFYDVTFNVNMANEDVSGDGVFLAGGVHFGWPGDNPMSDDDGDGIWTITVNLAEGTAGNYTFLNGNCGDWSCKEDLSDQECGDPNNYNDRILEPVTGDTVLSTCFGQCSTDGTCAAPPASYDVTFQVDMSQYEGAIGTVNLNGNFAGWCGSCIAMSDDNGDGIYAVTVELGAGQIEYKFTVDGWNAQEEFAGGESCTLTSGPFTNRVYEVTGDVMLNVVCWNSCDACPEDVLGCTDASACNYDDAATADDGSCEAPDALTGCGDTCLDGGILYEFNISDVYSDGMCCAYGEGSYSIVVDGEVIASGGDFGASASEQFCAPAEACVQIVMVADNYPSEQSWSVTADGVEVLGAGLNGATATYYLGGCLPGCTDEAACNYDISANVDDDSCLELDACGECGGSGVDTDGDGVCDAEEIAGCQDEAACNYNPAATDPIPASGLNISLSAGSWPSEISWTLNGESYGAPFEGLIELAPGMYTLEGADSYGDGWNGAQMTIVDAASGASASFSVSGSSDSIEIEVTGAEGCTYAPEFYQCDGETCVNDADGDGVCDELEIDGCVVPTACNYDLNATNLVPCVYPEPGYTCDGECDGDADGDGICDDNEIAGCQDETACNYNPDATDPAAINGLTISLSAGS